MSSNTRMTTLHPDGVSDYGATRNYREVKDIESPTEQDRLAKDTASTSSSESTGQHGVRAIEAVSQVWTKKSLLAAYFGLFLMAFVVSLQGQVTVLLTTFATSAFKENALLGLASVLQSVFLSVSKPPMAKIADALGRLEAFIISTALFIIGYIMIAASQNVKTYLASLVFYSAGSTGVQVLQQIFIADTSNLLNRALLSSLPDFPFVATFWIAPPTADSLLSNTTWRWGYGLWAIVLPVAFLPLAASLFLNQRKAARAGVLPESQFRGKSFLSILKHLWFELDLFGLLLLCAAVCLILIPCTLAPNAVGGWSNPSMIAMIVVGGICLVVFPFWERSDKLAPKAFFPKQIFRQRNVVVGTILSFFYFMPFYLSVQPYFQNWLLVVQDLSVTAAGNIIYVFNFSSSVTAVTVSILIKYTKHYKYFITLGAAIYMMGIGLMIKYRSIGTSTASLVGIQIAIGIGGGMVNVPAQLGVQASVSHHEVAAATAVFLTLLEIGGAVGSAISTAVWTSNLLPKLQQYLPPDTRDQASVIFGDVNEALKYPVGSPSRLAINQAYQETMHTILIIGVCVCAPLIPLSLLMKNYRLDKIDQKVSGRVIGGTEQTSGRPEGQKDD